MTDRLNSNNISICGSLSVSVQSREYKTHFLTEKMYIISWLLSFRRLKRQNKKKNIGIIKSYFFLEEATILGNWVKEREEVGDFKTLQLGGGSSEVGPSPLLRSCCSVVLGPQHLRGENVKLALKPVKRGTP